MELSRDAHKGSLLEVSFNETFINQAQIKSKLLSISVVNNKLRLYSSSLRVDDLLKRK